MHSSEIMASPAAAASSSSSDNTPPIDDSNAPSSATPFPNPNIHNPTILETSQWWAESISIHGLSYALERGHFRPWKTLAWSAVVVAAAGGLLWALIAECRDFAKFNVDTTTKTVIPTSLTFPRVTICNANAGIDATLQNSTGIKEPRDEEELVAISQPLEDFILYAQFNTKVYDSAAELAEVWTPVITPLGLCFSFVTDERVFIPGTSAGLTVYTWLDQSSYPETAEWAGVRVFVSNNNMNGEVISHQTSGAVIVPPGAVSFVAVTLQDFHREEDEPWTYCVRGGSSIEQCRTECIMSATKDKCGCRLIGDKGNSSPTATNPLMLLDYCNSTHLECTSSIGDEDLISCQMCPVPPCKEQIFSTRYSAGRISQKTAEYARIKNNNASLGDVAINFAAIHVNYDSIRYEETTESKSTSVSQLFSNLGGSLGFFMGISIISLVELLELIGLRLLPRLLCGKRLLYGIGQKKFD